MLKKIFFTLTILQIVSLSCFEPLPPQPTSPTLSNPPVELARPFQISFTNTTKPINNRTEVYERDIRIISIASAAACACGATIHTICCPIADPCPFIAPSAILSCLSATLLIAQEPIRKFQEQTKIYPSYYDKKNKTD